MDGKLDGYKLDRYELLDLVELGHRRNDKLLSETEPITLQVFEHSFDLENGYYCNDGKFTTRLCFNDKNLVIEGNSLVRVSNGRVEKSNYSNRNLLVMDCEVLIPGHKINEFTTSDTYEATQININDTEEDLQKICRTIRSDRNARFKNDLWKQAKNKEHTDVKFIFPDEQVLHAHKVILCCTSEVFQRQFAEDTDFVDKHEVIIEDSSKEAFHDFLHFMYKGFTNLYNIKHHMDLLYLANKYLVEDLQLAVRYFFECHFKLYPPSFGDENWASTPSMKYLEIYLLNRKVQDDSIARSTRYVIQDALSIIQDPDFINLPFQDIKEFLSLEPQLEATPNQLLDAVIRWADQQQDKSVKEDECQDVEILKQNIKELFKLIDMKEVTLTESDLEKFSISEVISKAALQNDIGIHSEQSNGTCLEDACICGTDTTESITGKNIPEGGKRFITCCSVDIATLDRTDDQIVYSKKMKLETVTAKIQILFQKNQHASGNVTLILTMLPRPRPRGEVIEGHWQPAAVPVGEEKHIFGRIEFLLFNDQGHPISFQERDFFEDYCGLKYWDGIYLYTNKREIISSNVYSWNRLRDPNKEKPFVHFKIYLEERPGSEYEVNN